MAMRGPKHELGDVIPVPYPTDGINNSSPAQTLPDSQAEIIENFFYDYSSGILRTRYPFRRYSNSILDGAAVNGITFWNNAIVFSAGGNLYYLDGSQDSVSIGSLNGIEPTRFLAFHSLLFVASGGVLQQVTTLWAISDTSNAPDAAIDLIEKNSQIGCIRDSTTDDEYWECAVNDETTWAGVTSEQYPVGYYEDDVALIGLEDGPYGFVVIWKKGTSNKSTWWLNPNASSPVAKRVSTKESSFTKRACAWVANKLFFMDEALGFMAMEGVDETENLKINEESLQVGSRIVKDWSMDANAFCVAYPKHSQLWLFPKIQDSFWVYDYRNKSIVSFKASGGLKFYSGFTQPNGTLMMGGEDGYIYQYEDPTTGTGNYQDDPGGVDTDYIQKFYSKIFEPFPLDEHIMKRLLIDYNGLKVGAGTLNVLKEFGSQPIKSDYNDVAVTITSSYPDMGDWVADDMGDHEDTYMWVNQMQSLDINKNSPGVDNLRLQLEITSGAIEIRGISMHIARGRKE